MLELMETLIGADWEPEDTLVTDCESHSMYVPKSKPWFLFYPITDGDHNLPNEQNDDDEHVCCLNEKIKWLAKG